MKVEVMCEVLKGDKGQYWTRGTVLSDPLPPDIRAEVKAGRRTVRVIEEKVAAAPPNSPLDPAPAKPDPIQPGPVQPEPVVTIEKRKPGRPPTKKDQQDNSGESQSSILDEDV